jgi:rRNA maturation endonuclease Nob1
MKCRCIACNKVISRNRHYCFTCLTELTEKAEESE